MIDVEDEDGNVKQVPDKPLKMRAQELFNLKQRKDNKLLKYIDLKKHFVFHLYTSHLEE